MITPPLPVSVQIEVRADGRPRPCGCRGGRVRQCWVIGPDHIEQLILKEFGIFRIFRPNFGAAVLEMLQSDPTLACTVVNPDGSSVII